MGVVLENLRVDPVPLVAEETGLVSDNGDVRATFATDTANAAEFEANGCKITMTPGQVKYIDPVSFFEDVVFEVDQADVFESRGYQALYQRRYGIIDETWRIEAGQIKHNITLRRDPREPSFMLENPLLAVATVIQLSDGCGLRVDGKIVMDTVVASGAIEVVNSDGNAAFDMPPVLSWDQKRTESAGMFVIRPMEGGLFEVSSCVSYEWLSDASREYPVVIDPTIVVSSAFDTSGNGGRKLVALPDGWLVGMVFNSTTSTLLLEKSADKGATWTQLCSISGASTGAAIANVANVCTVLFRSSSTTVSSVTFDATTVTNIDLNSTKKLVDTQTLINTATSITSDGAGALHAAYLSSNATYPSTFNARYSKSTDGGLTWQAPMQVTSYPGVSVSNVSIAVNAMNQPRIAVDAGTRDIRFASLDGTVWSDSSVDDTTFSKRRPCLLFASGSYYIFYEKMPQGGDFYAIYCISSPDGITWSAAIQIGTYVAIDQSNPTPVADENTGDLYVFWQGRTTGTYDQIRRAKRTAGTWGAPVDLTTNTTGHAQNPAALWSKYNNNSGDALRWIYTDAQASAVKFDSINLNAAPLTPTLTQHANFDAKTAQTLLWTFNDLYGDTQSAYELEVYDTATPAAPVIKIAKTGSTASQYDLLANLLTNGKTYQWRVKTYDSVGAESPWSNYSTFKCSTAPQVAVVPISGGTVAADSYTFGGTYVQGAGSPEQSNRFRLYDSTGGIVVQDSGDLLGTTNSKTFSGLQNNTTYQIEFSATSQDGITATSAKVPFTVAFAPPLTPLVSVVNDPLVARNVINWSNPAITTNLVRNSDFEIMTGTATVFSSTLTSGVAWTTLSGSGAFSSSGWTSGANNSRITAGNVAWKPIVGSGGQTLALTAQATFTFPASIGNAKVQLFQSASNFYNAYFNSAGFAIEKWVNGVGTSLNSTNATVATASMTATITLSLTETTDANGVVTQTLTAKLYSGSGTGGALLQTLTKQLVSSSTSLLTGGNLICVGADQNISVTAASVSAPMANGWVLGGDLRNAWAIQARPGGGYFASCVGAYASNSSWLTGNTTPVTANMDYAVSALMSGTGLVTPARAYVNWIGGAATQPVAQTALGTVAESRFSKTTSSGTANSAQVVVQHGGGTGTATFDSVQFEQNSAFTTYVRNDSLTASASNAPTVSHNDVYRRPVGAGEDQWKLVAQGATAPLSDYTCPAGAYEYGVRGVSVGGALSAYGKSQVAHWFNGQWLIDESNPANSICFKFNQNGAEISPGNQTAYSETFAKFPRERRGPQDYKKGTLAALMTSSAVAQTQLLDSMARSTNTYLLKFAAGYIYRVRIAPPKYHARYGGEVADCTVDWTEVTNV